jgi:hypothetical protein
MDWDEVVEGVGDVDEGAAPDRFMMPENRETMIAPKVPSKLQEGGLLSWRYGRRGDAR